MTGTQKAYVCLLAVASMCVGFFIYYFLSDLQQFPHTHTYSNMSLIFLLTLFSVMLFFPCLFLLFVVVFWFYIHNFIFLYDFLTRSEVISRKFERMYMSRAQWEKVQIAKENSFVILYGLSKKNVYVEIKSVLPISIHTRKILHLNPSYSNEISYRCQWNHSAFLTNIRRFISEMPFNHS